MVGCWRIDVELYKNFYTKLGVQIWTTLEAHDGSHGASSGRGGRFPNFNSIKGSQSHRDEREKHKGVTCFKCNQDGHIMKN